MTYKHPAQPIWLDSVLGAGSKRIDSANVPATGSARARYPDRRTASRAVSLCCPGRISSARGLVNTEDAESLPSCRPHGSRLGVKGEAAGVRDGLPHTSPAKRRTLSSRAGEREMTGLVNLAPAQSFRPSGRFATPTSGLVWNRAEDSSQVL